MRRAILAIGTLLLTTHTAFALNPALDVSQYVHTMWRTRDGFVGGSTITAIAQTPDGYLWLGTDRGLFRFDGVRSVPWQAPANQSLPSSVITNVLSGRDGTLWIGTAQGLASWKDGRLTQYGAVARRRIGRMVEIRDGSVWLAAGALRVRSTLCSIQSGQVECHGEDGGPGAGALGLYGDSQGTLWTGTSDGVWKWTPEPRRFYSLPRQVDGFRGLTEDDDGSLLIATPDGIKRLRDGRAEMAYAFPHSMQQVNVNQILRDREGGLWLGTAARGLVHIHQGITDVFTQVEGLSGDSITETLEDREGTIWGATRDGLDRFRDAPVSSFSARQALSNSSVQSLLAARDGSVWVGTQDGVNRLNGSRVTVYRERRAAEVTRPTSRDVRDITVPGLSSSTVSSLFEDHLGRIWVAGLNGVGHFENGRFVALSGLPGGLTRAIAEDSASVWVVNQDRGLYEISADNAILRHVSWDALSLPTAPVAVAADRSRPGLWLGFLDGGVVNLVDGRILASYGAKDGLWDNTVRHLHQDRTGAVWAATDGGLYRLHGRRVTRLSQRNGLPCDTTHWVVEDAKSFWVGMACGLVQIARSDIDNWVAITDKNAEADPAVKTRVLGNADGVRFFATGFHYTEPAVVAADGRLYFVSPDGLSVLDPGYVPFNKLPPPVHIEQLVADGTTHGRASNDSDLRLPALTRNLQIDYTALSLIAPEKMQFRYTLEGWDRDWQDVGTRRQAFYANLPPRTYRFRVIASNDSGVWNETGATLDFTITPAYYQTSWFPALVVGMALTVIWTAHRVRLRIVEKHEREISALNERLMKAQEQERIRIAGELHDGVMQQMLAVTMMLGTAKRRTSESDTKTSLDKIQDKLIQAGTEIRQLSHDLHPPILQEAGLPDAVRGYCEEFSASSGIPVSCDADDEVRDLSRGAALALFRIVQEALGNAAKHAHAKQITVRLTRSADHVSLAVSDDGAGFDSGKLSTSGGLGLVMMRERAGQLNGTLGFDSAPGRGTTIRVVIPFR